MRHNGEFFQFIQPPELSQQYFPLRQLPRISCDLSTRTEGSSFIMHNVTSSLSQTYVKFFNLMRAVRQKDRLFALDPVDERLLSSFATVWSTGEHLTASDAAMIVPDVAPRTVQRRVAALIEKGLLRVENDVDDNRIKYFFATDKTNEYFAEISKCFEQAKDT